MRYKTAFRVAALIWSATLAGGFVWGQGRLWLVPAANQPDAQTPAAQPAARRQLAGGGDSAPVLRVVDATTGKPVDGSEYQAAASRETGVGSRELIGGDVKAKSQSGAIAKTQKSSVPTTPSVSDDDVRRAIFSSSKSLVIAPPTTSPPTPTDNTPPRSVLFSSSKSAATIAGGALNPPPVTIEVGPPPPPAEKSTTNKPNQKSKNPKPVDTKSPDQPAATPVPRSTIFYSSKSAPAFTPSTLTPPPVSGAGSTPQK